MRHPAGPVSNLSAKRFASALTLAICLLACVAVRAQPTRPAAALSAPARPDVERLGFVAPDSLPSPVALHVLSDTVSFGGLLPVAWDLPPGVDAPGGLPAPAGDQLATVPAARRPWWKGGGRQTGVDVGTAAALEALPPAAGRRVVSHYRVYRTEAFRLEWAGGVSAVVAVQGRVADPDSLAAIRDPRAWGWFTPALGFLLAGLALVAAAAWWLWRRRRRGAEPSNWPLPEPAWIGAALALKGLLEEHRLERGEPKAFLDGLAAVARGFAATHYGVPAMELTGDELVGACAARGYETAPVAALARLIDAADLRRYDPEPPVPGWCQAQAVELVARMTAAKVQPRQTPVEAGRLLAAAKAWASIEALAPSSRVVAGAHGVREGGR